MARLKVLEGEGQADGVEAQLLQAPHNGGKVLGQAVVALAQVARRCQPGIEAIPAALSGLQNDHADGACRLHSVICVAFFSISKTEADDDLPQLASHEEIMQRTGGQLASLTSQCRA